MKVETKLFGLLVVFFLPVAYIYGHFTRWHEPVGFAGLVLTAALCALIAFYLWWTGRKLEERPEDDPAGEIAQAEGDYGFFSPHSWWPLAVGATAAMVFLGLAIGWWLVIIGIPLAAMAVVGWTFEYFKGDHAL